MNSLSCIDQSNDNDYDAIATSSKKFAYLCSSCSSAFQSGAMPKSFDEIVDHYCGKCLSCGQVIEDSAESGLLLAAPPPISQRQSQSTTSNFIVSRQQQPKKWGYKRVVFQRASSYMRFSLDFLPLDRLLQPLEPGNLVMLKGTGASAIAELLAFRAQLPLERGGLDSAAFFIDAGNCSDPYLLASLAKRYSLDSKRALRRVTNCRVFTMHQLTGLLSDSGTLADMADSYGSKLIILANLLGTFDEPETSQSEIDRLLNVIHTGLTEVKKKLTIIITLGLRPTSTTGSSVAGRIPSSTSHRVEKKGKNTCRRSFKSTQPGRRLMPPSSR